MKEKDINMMKQYSPDALAKAEVVVSQSYEGARLNSPYTGWKCEINGFPVSSARQALRIFASLDTVEDFLSSMGIYSFTVKGGEQ